MNSREHLPPQPIPVCGICQSDKVLVKLDIGCDIDPSGEEQQHLNVCQSCGAEQFWVDRWDNFVDYKLHHGRWRKKGDCWPLD